MEYLVYFLKIVRGDFLRKCGNDIKTALAF